MIRQFYKAGLLIILFALGVYCRGEYGAKLNECARAGLDSRWT